MQDKLRPLHPGEIIVYEFLVHDAARNLEKKSKGEIKLTEIMNLCDELISINDDLAERLSKHLNTSKEFFMNLQKDYDQEKEKHYV